MKVQNHHEKPLKIEKPELDRAGVGQHFDVKVGGELTLEYLTLTNGYSASHGGSVAIGGGFGKGIHNCLEAAVYNIPVIFGPNYQKFKEAKEFISLGIAKSVNNPNEFRNAMSNFEKLNIKQISKDYFKKKIGASETITQYI